jgi:ATP-dependent DNA helicase RecQ
MCDVCGNAPEWLNLPAEELTVKKKRKPKTKSEPVPALQPPAAPAPAPVTRRPLPPIDEEMPDSDLLTFFKEWRRRTAQRTGVPAYVVLSDAALVDLCRKQPTNLRELLGVFGFGERKAELYGGEIFAALESFRKGARATVRQAAQASPADETMRLLAEGKTFEEIAQIRGRQLSTVVNMVADLVEKGRLEYRRVWVGQESHTRIEDAINRLGSQWLKPLREALPAEISYEQIRLVVAWVRSQSVA